MLVPPVLDGLCTSPDWNLYEGGLAVWSVGAFEQHGRHLPLMTDNLTAAHFSKVLAAGLGAVLLPNLPFGTSLEQSGFRGSISLSPELLMAIVQQMADELEAQNFTRLIILSGHGGNFSLYPAARAINRADRRIKVLVSGVGDALSRVTADGAIEMHAGERETSIMLALHPELVGDDRVDASPDVDGGYRQPDLNAFGFGRMSPEGVWGRATRATAIQGRDLVARIEAHLLEWAKTSLARLAEDERYGGPGRVSMRPMTTADIPLGMRLKAAAHWNQTEADWQLLLGRGSQGCAVAVHNGQAAGTVTTIDYGGRFCWIGMVLVDPAQRRRGVGTALLQAALDAATSPVRLDATPEGKKLYDTLGFRDEYTLTRFECDAIPPPAIETTRPPGSIRIRPATIRDLDHIVEYDTPIFGANRRFLLEHLINVAPRSAWIAEHATGDAAVAIKTVVGFCLGRPGSRFEQIGPVVANSPPTAIALAAKALGTLSGRAVIIDAIDAQPLFVGFLKNHGFRVQRSFIRMVRGDHDLAGQPERQFGITGPELG